MPEARAYLLSLGGLALLLALVCGFSWYIFTYGDELPHKAGWSVLQNFAFDERKEPFVRSELKYTSDRSFAAVSILGMGEPLDGSRIAVPGKAWVLLNEHAADESVLVLPRYASYRVSCATVGRLPAAVPNIDAYV